MGEGTAYVISIKNQRTVADQNVVLTVELPAGLKFASLTGPGDRRNVSPDGKTIQVNPIQEVRPGETLPPFHLEATGQLPGEQVLKVTVTSRLSPQGVTAQETTTVFNQ